MFETEMSTSGSGLLAILEKLYILHPIVVNRQGDHRYWRGIFIVRMSTIVSCTMDRIRKAMVENQSLCQRKQLKEFPRHGEVKDWGMDIVCWTSRKLIHSTSVRSNCILCAAVF